MCMNQMFDFIYAHNNVVTKLLIKTKMLYWIGTQLVTER